MPNMYSRIDKLCKKNLTNVTELCRELKIGRSSLSELSRGRSKELNATSTAKIAEYFNVSPGYLTEGIPPQCAKHFISDDVRESVKADNRIIVNDSENYSLQERVLSQIKIYECLFSRSYESQGYNQNHVAFAEYVALILGQKSTKNNMSDDVYNSLVIKYGKKDGMEDGTTYVPVNDKTNTCFNINDISFAAYQELKQRI